MGIEVGKVHFEVGFFIDGIILLGDFVGKYGGYG